MNICDHCSNYVFWLLGCKASDFTHTSESTLQMNTFQNRCIRLFRWLESKATQLTIWATFTFPTNISYHTSNHLFRSFGRKVSDSTKSANITMYITIWNPHLSFADFDHLNVKLSRWLIHQSSYFKQIFLIILLLPYFAHLDVKVPIRSVLRRS
jgi:hypothetical protein